jgi:hypothetical protein
MNTATTTTTITLNEGFLSRRRPLDWLFALLVIAAACSRSAATPQHMDVYEKGILLGSMPAAIWLGWFWRPVQAADGRRAALSLLAIGSYQGDLARADSVFWLKYFLSSQSAILWMSVLFFMSTASTGSACSAAARPTPWSASARGWRGPRSRMALVGTMVRWWESYLIGPTSATSR